MNRILNITADDIKQAGGQLRLQISDVTVEELPKLDGTDSTHQKIVLHLSTPEGAPFKSFIANKTSLTRLASVESDPNKWAGLIVIIKSKRIAITDRIDATKIIRYEDQKYIESVEGAVQIDLVDQLIAKLT